MLKSRTSQTALGAALDVEIVDVCLGFFEFEEKTAESHEQNERLPEHRLRTRSLFLFRTNNDIYFGDHTKAKN